MGLDEFIKNEGQGLEGRRRTEEIMSPLSEMSPRIWVWNRELSSCHLTQLVPSHKPPTTVTYCVTLPLRVSESPGTFAYMSPPGVRSRPVHSHSLRRCPGISICIHTSRCFSISPTFTMTVKELGKNVKIRVSPHIYLFQGDIIFWTLKILNKK